MENKSVPEATLEFAIEALWRVIKRLIIIIIILIVALVGTNVAWIIYESQFETVAYDVQAGDGGNANYIGNDGDIDNGQSNGS